MMVVAGSWLPFGRWPTTKSQRPTTAFMRIGYLDCFSGISGDMFLGALIDAGVSPRVLEDAVTALNIGAGLQISRVNRSGISATKVDVIEDVGRTLLSAQQRQEPPV